MSVVRTLFSIILLRQGPQDLPFSPHLLQWLVAGYIASGWLVLQGSMDAGEALANMVLDVLVILFYTYLVLQALNKKPRFNQTACAMIGVGMVFHFLAWPAMLALGMEQGVAAADEAPALASVSMLLLISWNLLVVAHIFRHALDATMSSAILLSFALFFVSIALSRLLFNG